MFVQNAIFQFFHFFTFAIIGIPHILVRNEEKLKLNLLDDEDLNENKIMRAENIANNISASKSLHSSFYVYSV